MNDIKVSKLMSLVLRHKPETIGINLDENGWADIKELINRIRNNGFPDFNIDYLSYIVENNDKKRFKISDNGLKIRASQGHSIK
jgi:putative RNA 2'-phosphotransferase